MHKELLRLEQWRDSNLTTRDITRLCVDLGQVPTQNNLSSESSLEPKSYFSSVREVRYGPYYGRHAEDPNL